MQQIFEKKKKGIFPPFYKLILNYWKLFRFICKLFILSEQAYLSSVKTFHSLSLPSYIT